MNKDKWVYYLIRIATFPFGLMPYSWLRSLGKPLGLVAYYLMKNFRKRTFSNLALATDLNLTPEQIVKISKKSFQNLITNGLEYPKLSMQKTLSSSLHCKNPEDALKIHQSGKGIIFFCGHQSNWEVLFLDATSRIPGTAIGKPIKNKYLYDWIVSIREKNGGKIIIPRNAVKEGLRALRKGEFIGIVGDQGMPDSGYSFPFLGRRAWTSPAPALLAYKTNSPIIFASTKRTKNGFETKYSDPIWPNTNEPMEVDVVRMMDKLMSLLEKLIVDSPGEWLWQHNRWKQQTTRCLYKRFRQDSICIILPEENFMQFAGILNTLKRIYESAFLFLFIPWKYKDVPLVEAEEVFYYKNIEETLREDYRFKLVFNFTNYTPIHKHYRSLSAFEVLNLSTIQKLALEHTLASHTLSDIIKRALCRPGSIWENQTNAV
jgi:KDO2-lipid IV(A) lauroyltransferase